MHTHAGPRTKSRPTSAAPASTSHAQTPGGASALPEVLRPDDATELQRSAGNRATVQRLRDGTTVQRVIDQGQAATIAARLHDAMAGLGTDEEAVYGALTSRTQADIEAIKEAYLGAYDTSLVAEIEDEFSGDELAKVRTLLEGKAAPAADASDEARKADTASTAKAIAEQLRDAMEGAGTEEDQIFNALEGRSPAEHEAIRREYLALTGRRLEEDLLDDLSGDDLRKALDLLGVKDTATFTNRIEQNMTEQAFTVVKGRFNWTLTDSKLEVDVPAHFNPAEGLDVPLGTWQSEIAARWNKYAVRSTDGEKAIPIEMKLRDDPNDARVINVVQNAVPGAYGSPDRANAGMWYPVMKAGIAPHEFGHLIGLPDEYQRTHGDYKKIMGKDKAGPTNESGRTAEQIATDLHAKLAQEDVTRRGPDATTVLTSAGLIKDGKAMQGDFAQEVMTAYDAAFSPALLPHLATLPKEGRWMLQTVFSYASTTTMGNPEVVPVDPHEHSVETRHLREFQAIVEARMPEKTWVIGNQ